MPQGDSALLLYGGELITPSLHRYLLSLSQLILQENIQGVIEVLVTYSALTVIVEPRVTSVEQVQQCVEPLLPLAQVHDSVPSKTVSIPVCYHPSLAPDLLAVAAHCGLSSEQVVEWHSQSRYTVYFLGFMPGFLYLGGLAPVLHCPRLQQPRLNVAPGSVGIGGGQTGIYPLASPGGWQLIGRTPAVVFKPYESPAVLANPGDTVIFDPITLDCYQQCLHDQGC